MLMLMRFSICTNLLKETASNSKLGYISFYINLLKRVEIDKNKRLSKDSFQFLKTLFNIRNPLKKSSFRLFSILIKRFIRLLWRGHVALHVIYAREHKYRVLATCILSLVVECH